jgi:phage RecT family recombinase
MDGNAAATTRTAAPAMELAEDRVDGQDVVVYEGGGQTVAQQRKARTGALIAAFDKRRADYETFLNAYGISFEVFTAVIKQALVKQPDLLDCSAGSVLQAALMCAKDGLVPDGKRAAITKFGNVATYQPMYEGMLEIAYDVRDAAGNMVYRDVEVDVVYKGEEELFEYRRGDDGYIRFSPPLDRDITAEIAGAYCIIRTTNGGVFREVIGGKELKKIRAVSKAKKGPNVDWPAQMAKKAPLRRLLKITPKNARLQQAMTHDENSYLTEVPGPESAAPQIGHDQLFDDKAVHVAAGGETVVEAEVEPVDALSHARALLMECESAEQLESTIGYINAAPEFAGLSAEDRESLAKNAQVMAQRFGAADITAPTDHEIAAPEKPRKPRKSRAEKIAHPDTESGGTGVAADAVHEPEAAVDPVTGEVVDDPAALGGSGGSYVRAVAPVIETVADDFMAGPDTPPVITDASFEEIDETPARVGGPKVEAKAEPKVTPAEAAATGDFYMLSTDTPNASKQRPYYDEKGQIRGYALDSQGIRVLDAHPNQPQAAPAASDRPYTLSGDPWENGIKPAYIAGVARAKAGKNNALPEFDSHEAAASHFAQPEIRRNPEDRVDPAQAAPPEQSKAEAADEYGAGETAVLRGKFRPSDPAKEYTDPALWMADMLNKLQTVSEQGRPMWFADNLQFIREAHAVAPEKAMRILAVAAAHKLPGAAEAVQDLGR